MSQVTTPGGGGVDGSGTANEVTIWANATTLKGETGLTYSASKLSVSNRIDVGDVGAAGTIENTNTNQNLQLEVSGTGLVEVENQTVNNDSTFQVKGNGTGTPKLQLTNDSKAVTMQCDDNQKLKVKGGSDSFTFDVSSATGGITFPDSTVQTTAATGGGGYGKGGVASFRIDGGWDGATNNWHCMNEVPVYDMDASGVTKKFEVDVGSTTIYIPIYVHKAMTVDYMAVIARRSSGAGTLTMNVYGIDANNLPTGSPVISETISTFGGTSTLEWAEVSVGTPVALTAGFYWAAFESGSNIRLGGNVYPSMNSTPAYNASFTPAAGNFNPFFNIPIGAATTAVGDNTFTPALQDLGSTPMDPIDLTQMTAYPNDVTQFTSRVCPGIAFREQ